MPVSVVFVSCLGHSGSTVVDLILGGHPRFVGLGEFCSLLDPAADWLDRTADTECSCGKTLDECVFWGPVCERLREHPDLSFPERYQLVLSAFDEILGEDRILVDSSKELRHLQMLKDLPEITLKALFIIRDVRSWVISRNKADIRHGNYRLADLMRKHGRRAWRGYLQRTWPGLFWQWYRGNRRMQRFFKDQGLPVFQFGYEELALYPERVIPKICEFLGVDFSESMMSLQESGSHCALGNRMRTQKEKRRRIFYDNRWFHRREWQLPAAAFPNIMRYNTAEVYRNTRDAIWSK